MSRNHRSSCRFPLPAGQDQAVLRAGSIILHVKILNASATGFLLECPKVDVVAGDVLTLATLAGLSEICVAFSETTSDVTRLGVQRVRDLDEPPSAGASIPWHSIIPGFCPQAGGAGNVAIAVVALAVLVAGGAYLVSRPVGTAPRSASLSSAGNWISRKASQTDRQVQQAIDGFSAWLQGRSPGDPPHPPIADVRPVSTTSPPQASATIRAPAATRPPRENHILLIPDSRSPAKAKTSGK